MISYIKKSLSIRILLGLTLGAITGLTVGPNIPYLNFLGNIFLQLLNIIVVPLVAFNLTLVFAKINTHLVRVSVKAILLHLFITTIAVILGLAIGNILKPGEIAIKSSSSLFMMKNSIMPSIILCSFIIGCSISLLRKSNKEKADIICRLLDKGTVIINKMVCWILQYAPIAVFSLIAVFFGDGLKNIEYMAIIIISVYLALLIHMVLIYGFLSLLNLNPFNFIICSIKSIITGFVTCSSSIVLPMIMDDAKEMGLDKTIYTLLLPLGATIFLHGSAIYQGVCSIFIGNITGNPLVFEQQIIVALMVIAMSLCTAGVPGAGVISLMVVMDSVGIKIGAEFGMIVGIDIILDMGRSAVNVTGNLAVTYIVAKTENPGPMTR
ncbi:MAG: dicarboxylate/amino acid:cation symporter [bacterium]|nr:dicarboxylate/amino acid:cation symporter [bacterium]